VRCSRLRHCGATRESSAVDLPPHIDTSDQPLPGPANPTLQPSPRTRKAAAKQPHTSGLVDNRGEPEWAHPQRGIALVRRWALRSAGRPRHVGRTPRPPGAQTPQSAPHSRRQALVGLPGVGARRSALSVRFRGHSRDIRPSPGNVEGPCPAFPHQRPPSEPIGAACRVLPVVCWFRTSEWDVSRHRNSVSQVIGMAGPRQARPCRTPPRGDW